MPLDRKVLARAIGAGMTFLAAVFLASGPARSANTLEDIKERGHILCGVGETSPGFSVVDGNGKWSGMDVEFCRALAAAVLGDSAAVKFRGLSAADRFRALQDGEIDVLSRSTSWTLTRDTELGIRFVGILFYDGQGFLINRAHALTSVLELSGASICALTATTADKGLADFFGPKEMRFQLVSAARWEDLIKVYNSGGCTLLSGDLSQLAVVRAGLTNPADHMLLPEIVQKEPMGPAVRQADEQWFSIVRWTLMALLSAEELGLTSANVDDLKASTVLSIRHFLGQDTAFGEALGLAPDWTYRIVKQVGNYAEIYDRSLGSKSLLKLDRGFNALWTQGGLMYSPPFR